MNYDPQILKAVQAVELDILEEIERICAANDLTCFAIGGTHLGAVRHDGFIPWDDDIDLGMMRDDYEKFIDAAKEQLAEGFFLQHYTTEPDTPTYYVKVMREGTRFVERGKQSLDIHQCIFVDIMPFDEIPADEHQLKKYQFWARTWKEITIAKRICSLTVSTPMPLRFFATAFRTILHVLLIPISKDWIYRTFDKQIQQYNGCGSGRISCRGVKEFDADYTDIFPLQEHKFEHATILIPAKPDKVLTQQYGDWRKMPPPEKRHTHEPQELDLGEFAPSR